MDGGTHNRRLDEMVLDLLIHEEEHERDHSLDRTLRQGEQNEEASTEKATDLRNEVGEGGPDGGNRRERHAEGKAGRQDHEPVQHGHE